MFRPFLVSIFSLFLTIAFLPAQAGATKTRSVDEKLFSVQLPAAPSSVREVTDKGGKDPGRKTKSYRGKSGELEFELIVVEYTKNDLQGISPADYMRGYRTAESNAVERKKGKVIEDKGISRDGFGGLSLLLEDANKKLLHFVWYAADDRVYQLKLSGPKTAVESAEGKQFFDSFKLKK